MGTGLLRPPSRRDAVSGMIVGDHVQIAYATNDIERAKQIFSERYGIANWLTLAGEMPEGGRIHAEFAWSGGTMYELLTASGAGSDVYMETLPQSGFAIRHHHLGYVLRDLDEWHALEAEIARGGWTVRIDAHVEGFIRQIFIEAPELGHLLEYLLPEEAGLAFLNSVPAN